MTALLLADDATRTDLSTYVGRALAARDDGAMRLQAVGTTLAAWVGVLDGRGLMGEGTTIGLRTLHLQEPSDVDATVPLVGLRDRLARVQSGLRLDVPPQHIAPSWAALTPPRGGWRPIGQVSLDLLREVAAEGIEEITNGAPDGSGALAVQTLRWRVWSRVMPESSGIPGLRCGAAFALQTLGFMTGDHAQVHVASSWHRVTTPAGFVLVR